MKVEDCENNEYLKATELARQAPVASAADPFIWAIAYSIPISGGANGIYGGTSVR